MAYDPQKFDPYSNEPPRDLDENSAGVMILVGALLFAAMGGFIYLFAGPSVLNVATNDVRPAITTTGSSSNMPLAPQPRLEPKVKPVE